MSTTTIEVEGIPELNKRIRNVQQMKPLQMLLDEASLIAQAAAIEGAPRDTGELQRSIQRDVQPFSARVYTLKSYAEVMEFGRSPGGKMPPPQALAGWARRHGRDTSPSGLFVLARSIARRGIKGRFFMRKAADKTRRELPRLVQKMADRIENVWRSGAAGGG